MQGNVPFEALQQQFAALDTDGDGTVDIHEFVGGSILEALGRVDVARLFASMDTDGSQFIDRREFALGVRELGYDVDEITTDLVFSVFDGDGNGEIDIR